MSQRGRGLAASGLLLAACLHAGCGAYSPPPAPKNAVRAPVQVPVPRLPADRRILSDADIAVDDSGEIHLVIRLYTDWQDSLYYLNGRRTGSVIHWGDPVRVGLAQANDPHILALGSTIHILSGRGTAHRVSNDRGRTWKWLDDVVSCDSFRAAELASANPRTEGEFEVNLGPGRRWIYSTTDDGIERRSTAGGAPRRLHRFPRETMALGVDGLSGISVVGVPGGTVVSWVRVWDPRIGLPHPLAYADRGDYNGIEGIFVADSTVTARSELRRLVPSRTRPVGLRQVATEEELFTLWKADQKLNGLPDRNVGAALFLSIEDLDSLRQSGSTH